MINKLKRISMFVYLLVLLILFDRELARTGFNNTFKRYARKYFPMRQAPEDHDLLKKHAREIENTFELLDIVCAWYPRKADCIHKTMLGYRLIRTKYAFPVEMVVGIRKFPFEAHAWLIMGERNLFDNEETSHYKIILRSSDIARGEQG